MRKFLIVTAIVLGCASPALAARPPNFLVVVADDLGFSDIGCYGGEIRTPHLDALAANGLRFTQFYNTARCWPTRSAILTGYYAQQIRRDTIPGVRSGGGGVRPAWAPLLPERLTPLGYRSYHSGKWHLDGTPLENGFDRSYYLKDQGRFFNPKVHWEDDKPLPPVEPGSDYYATTAIADHAIGCLQQHAASQGDRPFFHYLAFTAPHFPLHALPGDIDRYREVYRQGWGSVRAKRWRRIQRLGIVSASLSPVERHVGPPYHFPDALEILGEGEVNRPVRWAELSEQQREFQAVKMAIHAAMIDRIDQELGRVLEQLREMGAYDNTLILFLSDNGASAEIMVRDDGHNPSAAPGSASTYLCLGPGWSTTSNTPFRRHKTWVHEGGIATPLIAHWPTGITARGELRRNPGHVIDIVPTILDLAGGSADSPNNAAGDAPPRPGKSLGPVLSKDHTVEHESLWWLHEGNRAIRVGARKLVAAKDKPWELYDLASDRTETNNLALQFPAEVQRLETTWSRLFDHFKDYATRDLPERPTRR